MHKFVSDNSANLIHMKPDTDKVLVLYDTKQKYWFLPKGRKDVGESLEETALREAYEEVRAIIHI